MRPGFRRRFILPALAGAVLLLVGGAAGYLTAPEGGLRLPAPEKADPAANVVHGAVQVSSATGLSLSTATGPLDLELSPQTAFERLAPVTVAAIRPGDWLNVGAVPNRQTLFAITGLTLIAAERLKERP